MSKETKAILEEIQAERYRQDAKWGEQNHPNGTSYDIYKKMSDEFRADCDRAAKEGKLTWTHILLEEFYEALAEEGKDALRKELLQTASVAVGWIEAIDRQKAKEGTARQLPDSSTSS